MAACACRSPCAPSFPPHRPGSLSAPRVLPCAQAGRGVPSAQAGVARPGQSSLGLVISGLCRRACSPECLSTLNSNPKPYSPCAGEGGRRLLAQPAPRRSGRPRRAGGAQQVTQPLRACRCRHHACWLRALGLCAMGRVFCARAPRCLACDVCMQALAWNALGPAVGLPQDVCTVLVHAQNCCAHPHGHALYAAGSTGLSARETLTRASRSAGMLSSRPASHAWAEGPTCAGGQEAAAHLPGAGPQAAPEGELQGQRGSHATRGQGQAGALPWQCSPAGCAICMERGGRWSSSAPCSASHMRATCPQTLLVHRRERASAAAHAWRCSRLPLLAPSRASASTSLDSGEAAGSGPQAGRPGDGCQACRRGSCRRRPSSRRRTLPAARRRSPAAGRRAAAAAAAAARAWRMRSRRWATGQLSLPSARPTGGRLTGRSGARQPDACRWGAGQGQAAEGGGGRRAQQRRDVSG